MIARYRHADYFTLLFLGHDELLYDYSTLTCYLYHIPWHVDSFCHVFLLIAF